MEKRECDLCNAAATIHIVEYHKNGDETVCDYCSKHGEGADDKNYWYYGSRTVKIDRVHRMTAGEWKAHLAHEALVSIAEGETT